MIHSDHESVQQHSASLADIPMIDHAALLQAGRHPDPGAVLGRHDRGECVLVRAFLPGAHQVSLVGIGRPLLRLADTDLFEWQGSLDMLPVHYQLSWLDASGSQCVAYDPYGFAPQLSLYDLHLFNEGRHMHVYRVLGAHLRVVDGIAGVLFAVWAPHAACASVAGDFNDWEGRFHPLRRRGEVWELFVPGVAAGMRYRFDIIGRETGEVAAQD